MFTCRLTQDLASILFSIAACSSCVSAGRLDIKSSSLCWSSRERVTLSPLASEPLNPRSQHDFVLCKYAPRPFIFPVGSIKTPSGRRTMRVIVRLASTVRQPTQVRWGICLGLPDFPAIFTSRHHSNHYRRACVSFVPQPRHDLRQIDIRQTFCLFCLSFHFFRRRPLLQGEWHRGVI